MKSLTRQKTQQHNLRWMRDKMIFGDINVGGGGHEDASAIVQSILSFNIGNGNGAICGT